LVNQFFHEHRAEDHRVPPVDIGRSGGNS
jgi:hypothetical protein